MAAYIDFLERRFPHGIRADPGIDPWGGFGDWVALDGTVRYEDRLGGTPKDLIGTAFLSYSSRLLADIARVLAVAFRERYFISGEINSEVADQQAKMREIEERYADGEISKPDGISVDYPDWHFNVRPSNTEPLLRLNLESLVSPDDMEQKRDEVLALIRS